MFKVATGIGVAVASAVFATSPVMAKDTLTAVTALAYLVWWRAGDHLPDPAPSVAS